MIAFVRGELVSADADRVVVETGGVGYNILVPQSLLQELPRIGQEVKLYTHFQVREDAMQLFGFLRQDDLEVFRLLLGVSGVGPKVALAVLGTLTPDELRMAVLAGDDKAIAKAPGLGKKTAQKVILELKDKMSLDDALGKFSEHAAERTSAAAASAVVSDAVQALTALGYSASESLKVIKSIEGGESMDVEDLLKIALKNMM